MINWIRTKFRKKERLDISIARPRIYRTKEGGEVTIKNLDPAIADRIKAVLEGTPLDGVACTPTTEETVIETQAGDVSFTTPSYGYSALGSFRDVDGNWKVVTIKYNPQFKVAEVSAIESVGMERAFAIERFKILASNNELV